MSLVQKIVILPVLFFMTHQVDASVPVAPALDQGALLASYDTKTAAKKILVYDFWRIVLVGRRLDQAHDFLRDDYIQHNPNVPTGLQGFLDFFSHLGGPRPIPGQIPNLVTIRAEGDFVILAFVNQLVDSNHQPYTTTSFDMFRIQDGKIAEHWDVDTKNP